MSQERLDDPGPPFDARGRVGWPALVAVGLVGIFMAHHPMLRTGLAEMQGSEDARLVNYFLEHSYLWMKQEPLHRRFWDIPFFYPTPNTAGFSDTMLTVAPIYWGWRATRLPPDTSFQLWMLTISALNVLAGYWLLRSGFRRGVPGSLAGAYLFAFAAPRVNEIEHPQLAAQIFTVATLMALIRIFRGPPIGGHPLRALAPWSAAGLGLVAQFYASFYLGWFLVLALAVAGAWGVILPRSRRRLVDVIRGQWMAIGIAAVLSALALRPLLDHYLWAMSEVGLRDYREAINASIPDWRSWIYMGPMNWAWGWTSRLIVFHGLGLEQAMRSGLGPVTTVACLTGLLAYRRSPAVRLIGLTAIGMAMAITRFDRQIVEGLALGLWTTCLLQIYRGGDSPRFRRHLGAFAALLASSFSATLSLAAPLILLDLLLVIGVPATIRVRRAGLEVVILAAAIGLPFLATHADRRVALGVAVAVATFLEIAGRRLATRTRLRLILVGGALACAGLWLFRFEINFWPYVSQAIPGGRALRAVSRGNLLGLIPAALGLACFVEFAGKRRMRRALIWAIGLAVILDQGVTTPGFDKKGPRARVAALARKIDRRSRSFFYSPRNALGPINEYHLDAMWAASQAGVPTVNGYSGAAPRGWAPLHYSSVQGRTDLDRLGQALSAWASINVMSPDDIAWIRDGDDPPPPKAGPAARDDGDRPPDEGARRRDLRGGRARTPPDPH